MRKFTLLLFSLLIGHFTYSQIVVSNADIVSKGSIVIQSNDDNPDPAIQPGEAGANMSWDFSALAESSVDTMAFVDPAQTPFQADFPSANLAIDISDSGYLYIERNNDRMALIGLAVEIDTLGEIRADVTPAQSMVEFPLEYGNTYSGTSSMVLSFDYSQPGVDSIMVKMNTAENREADAWGQMTIPMGTYNALRVHHTATIIDSIWIKTAFTGWTFVSTFETAVESYNWWSIDAGTGYVIATTNLEESRAVESVTYLKAEVTQGTSEFSIDNVNAEIYPNPVSNQLNIEFERDFTGSVQIIDLAGRIIVQKQIDGQKSNLDMSQENQGVYFYRILNESSGSAYSGKLIKR
ncbi:MAG: T9SS type A sorting domain-containing protein [Bacteroidota bacterium]|nr:T9SS type A sorting domain-containing protein [Bacteroidota bacterium]